MMGLLYSPKIETRDEVRLIGSSRGRSRNIFKGGGGGGAGLKSSEKEGVQPFKLADLH